MALEASKWLIWVLLTDCVKVSSRPASAERPVKIILISIHRKINDVIHTFDESADPELELRSYLVTS